MNKRQSTFLIFKSKTFPIPFEFLYDINENILKELLINGEYEVNSDVDEDIFQYFINNWFSNEIPVLSSDNIFQYELLSDEFDRMKNIIQIFKKYYINIEKLNLKKRKNKLQRIYQDKILTLKQFTQKSKQMINFIFNNKGINTYSQFNEIRKELYDCCIKKNVKLIDFLTQKEVIVNSLSFLLDEEKGEASVFRNQSNNDEIFIPRTIECNDRKFNVTGILEYAFKESRNIKTIKFSEDSEIAFIDDFSFAYSSLENISIPKKVREIGKSAFTSCRKLKTVKFSDESQLKIINESAFSFSSLEEIEIPLNVERIENRAFSSCFNLKSVSFLKGSKLKYIGSNAFSSSTIVNLSIPSSVKEIKEEWLLNSTKLANIKMIENDVKNISYYDGNFIISKSSIYSDNYDILSFSRKNINCAIIPAFIKRIGSYAFESCNMIKKIDFQENSKLISIGKNAFYMSSLESISIPSSTKHICESAFYKCKNLKHIEFSEGSQLHSIDKFAFSYSTIESISIPSCAIRFHKECFCHVQQLNEIKVFQSSAKNISIYDQKLLIGKTDTKSDKFDIILFASRDLKEVIIPSFIKQIAPYSFNECNQLTKVVFADDSELEIIDEFAFSHSSLECISIPLHVKQIQESSFSYCTKLSKVQINDHSELKMIDQSAFAYSYHLNEIFIPQHVTFIGESCFEHCTNLNKIEFAHNSELKTIQRGAFSYSSLTKIMIPSHVEKIEPNTFSSCKRFLTFECSKDSELKTISPYAFSYSSLERISIPSSIEHLLSQCFTKLPNLIQIEIFKRKEENFSYENKLIIGKTDQKSGKYDIIIYANQSLKVAAIPHFIEKIGQYSFCECRELKHVNFSDNSKLKIIEKSAFANTLLEKIIIPSSVTQICESSFTNCKELKRIEFSDYSNLKIIEKFAFSNSAIKSITIPPHVTRIGEYAFSKCSKLCLIEISDNSKTITIGKNIFYNTQNAILYISKNTKMIIEKCFN